MRVVAGRWKGRRLTAPRGTATRPTADRVREAIFSTIGALDGERVLDLYAGSGALGIEALSRGAAEAVFVERDRRAAAVVRRNLEAVGAENASVVVRDALAFLRDSSATGFDLIFLDPPYSSHVRLAAALSERLPRVATEDALIVTESSTRAPLELSLPLAGERTYGDTRVALHRVRE